MMAAKKQGALGNLFSEIVGRGLETMSELGMATTAATMDASIAGARRLIKFQRTCALGGVSLVAKVVQFSEKSLKDAVKDGKWLPKEGREVVDEWAKMMNSGLEEFKRVVEKSFDLLLVFLDRAEKEQKKSDDKTTTKPAKKSAAKKSPAKKAAAKKKSAPKKKSST